MPLTFLTVSLFLKTKKKMPLRDISVALLQPLHYYYRLKLKMSPNLHLFKKMVLFILQSCSVAATAKGLKKSANQKEIIKKHTRIMYHGIPFGKVPGK